MRQLINVSLMHETHELFFKQLQLFYLSQVSNFFNGCIFCAVGVQGKQTAILCLMGVPTIKVSLVNN